ncbi:hypothetical protein OIU77_000965 [Salix suchowensis]|uniref:CCT domain-containing protein n=1 Tax=Salix suchowensis TaxID=1278906 RepID=A0ABQ9BB25_9ROSI|nr:hypothetical protein OIU77_000965 [Salix suchowensis]
MRFSMNARRTSWKKKQWIHHHLQRFWTSNFLLPGLMKNPIKENKLLPDAALSKSVSSGCLSSIEWVHGAAGNPGFLDFPGIDFENAYGMRRAYSDGDIKTLGNGNTSLICSHLDRPLIINCSAEGRQEKLSRYRNKKTKRNFGRKIKYACRKALADSQPRIRGRFAKTEEWDVSKRQ